MAASIGLWHLIEYILVAFPLLVRLSFMHFLYGWFSFIFILSMFSISNGSFVFNFILSWLQTLKSPRCFEPTSILQHRSSAISRLIAVEWCSNKLHRSAVIRVTSPTQFWSKGYIQYIQLYVCTAPSSSTCSWCNCYNGPKHLTLALCEGDIETTLRRPSPENIKKWINMGKMIFVEWRKGMRYGMVWSKVISNDNIDRFFGIQIVQSKWANK